MSAPAARATSRANRGLELLVAVVVLCIAVFPALYGVIERRSISDQAGRALEGAAGGRTVAEADAPPVIRLDLAGPPVGEDEAYGHYPALVALVKGGDTDVQGGPRRFDSEGRTLFYLVEGSSNPRESDHRPSGVLVVDATAQFAVVDRTTAVLLVLALGAGGCIVVLGRRLARANEERERRVSEFFANTSHELKTPLAVIEGYHEAMASGVVDLRDGLPAVERATESMRRHVDDLLALSRADAGALNPAREMVDAREVVCDVLEDLDIVAAEAGVAVFFDDPGPVRGETDERMLAAMVTNLVTNAIRHGATGVWVSVAASGGGLEVTVENDGEVLGLEEAAHAFDHFWRGAGGSCGLGLPVVAAYAAALGGAVSLDGEGGRTVARLRIPFKRC